MARTTQECLDYIKQQPWYNSYKENVKQHSFGTPIEEIGNRNLISSAFAFSKTAEGSDYWYIINKKYLKWYSEPEDNSNEEKVMSWDCKGY